MWKRKRELYVRNNQNQTRAFHFVFVYVFAFFVTFNHITFFSHFSQWLFDCFSISRWLQIRTDGIVKQQKKKKSNKNKRCIHRIGCVFKRK